MVICLELGADLHMAHLMPLSFTVSCFSNIQICVIFLVPAYPGSPGKGPLNGCVCVCVCVCFWYRLIRVVLEKKPLNGCSSGSDSGRGEEVSVQYKQVCSIYQLR